MIILSMNRITFVAFLARIAGVSFKTTAHSVVIDGLTRSETATDASLTHWNTLSGGPVTVTIVRTIVVGLTFTNDNY